MSSRSRFSIFEFLLCAALLTAVAAAGTVPQRVSYQGRLVGYGTGPVDLEVRFWDDPVAGSLLFEECHDTVPLSRGVFSITIGAGTDCSSGTPTGFIPDSAFDADQVWLELTVGGSALPRTRILAVPYAVKSVASEKLVRPGTFDSVATTTLGGALEIGTALRLDSADGRVQSLARIGVTDALGNTDLAQISSMFGGGQLLLRYPSGSDAAWLRGAETSGAGPELKFFNSTGNTTVEVDGDAAGAGYGVIIVKNSSGNGTVLMDAAGDAAGAGLLTVQKASGTDGVRLSATDDNSLGGMIEVLSASGARALEMLGGNTSGGTTPRFSVLYPAAGSAGEVRLNAAFSGGRIIAANEAGTETVQIVAAESSGAGPEITLFNTSGILSVEIDGDAAGNGDGIITVKDVAGNGTVFMRGAGDAAGAGLLAVQKSNGTNGVRLSATDDNGLGGMLEVSSASGATAFEVQGGNTAGGTTPKLSVRYPAPGSAGEVRLNAAFSGGRIIAANETGLETVQILAANSSGAGPRIFLNDTAGDTVITLDGSQGRVKAKVVEITGADLAERFAMTESASPGMVVAIDPQNPGKLCLARGAYNRCVAGIVSGANALNAGAILGNLPESGDGPPVALSGRVWVYCDASDESIQPGDLLTTGHLPGHAMKAVDRDRSHGAILGKAMTALDEGTGLVLVLVNLQ